LTAAVTSIPDDDDPRAAWRIELRSIDEDEDEVDESRELSAETELITMPIPLTRFAVDLFACIQLSSRNTLSAP
jgi:hypothetical protein